MLVGFIPARGGSKGIPRKNLVLLAEHPLLSYTAEAAKASAVLDHILLSTDCEELGEMGRALGLLVPFLRPKDISGDQAPMLTVMQHGLGWCRDHLGEPVALVLLQPTSPLRTGHHVREAVNLFRQESPESVVSVVQVPHQYNPDALMELKSGRLVPRVEGSKPVRRQDKPVFYARNGPAILVTRPRVLDANLLYGNPNLPYVMKESESLDIDDWADLQEAEIRMGLKKKSVSS